MTGSEKCAMVIVVRILSMVRACQSGWDRAIIANNVCRSIVPQDQTWGLTDVPPALAMTRMAMTDQVVSRKGWEVRASLVCTLCGRTAGIAWGPDAQPVRLTSIRLLDASHFDAVLRRRCPHCSGRLWLQDYEDVYVLPTDLSAEDLHPRRGRPRKIPAVS
jgi:hypothetical protein